MWHKNSSVRCDAVWPFHGALHTANDSNTVLTWTASFLHKRHQTTGNSLIKTQRKASHASDRQSPNRFQACKNNPRTADIDRLQKNTIKSTNCFCKKVSLTFCTGGNLQITRLLTYARISNSLSRREIFLEIDFFTALTF